MQAKLQGGARERYSRLDDYNLAWGEWCEALRRAFPREHDFVDLLREMMARRKAYDETMTGLPRELQANARAYRCTIPGDLYTGFLSTFDRYQSPQSALTPVDRLKRRMPTTDFSSQANATRTHLVAKGTQRRGRCVPGAWCVASQVTTASSALAETKGRRLILAEKNTFAYEI